MNKQFDNSRLKSYLSKEKSIRKFGNSLKSLKFVKSKKPYDFESEYHTLSK